MSTVPVHSTDSTSVTRVACDLLLAGCFLGALSAASVDLLLCNWLSAAGAGVLALLFGWSARGMLAHLDRWTSNWEE